MGNSMTWQATAEGALANLAMALQPQHRTQLNEDECLVLAILLRQQMQSLPAIGIELAIVSDLVERMESKQAMPVMPVRLCVVAEATR